MKIERRVDPKLKLSGIILICMWSKRAIKIAFMQDGSE